MPAVRRGKKKFGGNSSKPADLPVEQPSSRRLWDEEEFFRSPFNKRLPAGGYTTGVT